MVAIKDRRLLAFQQDILLLPQLEQQARMTLASFASITTDSRPLLYHQIKGMSGLIGWAAGCTPVG